MKKILSLLFIATLLVGCTTTQKVTYFQDAKAGDSKNITTLINKIKMQPGDKLSIIVHSKDAELASPYNLYTRGQGGSSASVGGGSNGTHALYTIDSYGNIDFPGLGKLNIEGKTREEVAEYIKSEIISRKLILDAVVIVEYGNLEFTALGEVKKPGKHKIEKDLITIVDAIAIAGDLDIRGERNNVTVLRQDGDAQKVYELDLTSTENLYSSPAYYIQQNDVVYVKPNNKRAGESTINGNTLRSTSFWMSLASFVMALTTFIENR